MTVIETSKGYGGPPGKNPEGRICRLPFRRPQEESPWQNIFRCHRAVYFDKR